MHYIQPQINPRLTDRERETLVKRSVMYYSELSILSNFLRDSTIFVSEKSKLQIPTMRGSAINWRFVVVLALAVVGVMLLVLASLSENLGVNHGFISSSSQRRIYTLHAPHRKLLRHVKTATTAMKEPDRMWGERCTTEDIVINQGPTGPLPSGIPTYTVEIMNVCVTGCDISGIHLNCGWFSSAHLINPKIFKRLSYNDCLVNDGKALVNGGTLSFQYANTFLYPLSVSSVVCS